MSYFLSYALIKHSDRFGKTFYSNMDWFHDNERKKKLSLSVSQYWVEMISKTFLGKIKLFVSYIKLYEIKDSIKFSVCFVSSLIYIFFKKPAHSDHFRKWSLITVSLQNDHLSITTTFLWSQKWSLYTGLTVITNIFMI